MGHFSLFEAILSYFSQNPLDHTLQTVNTCHVSWEWWRVRFKDTAVGFQLRIRQSKVDISRVRGGIRGFGWVEWAWEHFIFLKWFPARFLAIFKRTGIICTPLYHLQPQFEPICWPFPVETTVFMSNHVKIGDYTWKCQKIIFRFQKWVKMSGEIICRF